MSRNDSTCAAHAEQKHLVAVKEEAIEENKEENLE